LATAPLVGEPTTVPWLSSTVKVTLPSPTVATEGRTAVTCAERRTLGAPAVALALLARVVVLAWAIVRVFVPWLRLKSRVSLYCARIL
jgi:hypothetical protein